MAPLPGAEISFSRDIQPIFNVGGCAAAFCHASGAQLAAPMSLEEGRSYASLVGVPSCEAPLLKRVEPGSSATSYLIHKLEGTQSDLLAAGGCATCDFQFGSAANCGSQMPLVGQPLDASLIRLIRDWIDQGAKDN
jgi:hypothetical protein